MLQYSLLSDFDEGQQQLGFATLGVRHQQSQIEFYLTIDIADLVLIHLYRRIEFRNELWYYFGRSTHDK